MLSPIRTVLIHYPMRFFLTIFVMMIISIYLFRWIKQKSVQGILQPSKGIILYILLNYILAILFFTVIGRRSWDYYRYNWDFGYSYREVFIQNKEGLAKQLIANIAIFIPVGFMSSCLFKQYALGKSVLYGCVLSLVIELLQLLLKRGCCEIDDLISNMIGTILGCLIIQICRLVEKRKRKQYESKRCKEHY